MTPSLKQFIRDFDYHLWKYGTKFADLSDSDQQKVLTARQNGDTPWMAAMMLDLSVSEETEEDRMIATTEGW